MSTFRSVKDIEYTKRKAPVRMDLHLPENAKGPVPVVLGLPGGGWRTAGKEGFTMFLPEAGIALACIEYSTSNNEIAPINVHDCKAAVRWLRSHAAEYNLDPDRIGVYGVSAGSHLACLLACANGVEELEGEPSDVSSRVQAVCAVCGPTDLMRFAVPETREEFSKLYDVIKDYLGGHIDERQDLARLVSPMTYVSADCPPMFLIHGSKDIVVPVEESLIFHEALKKAGASVSLKVMEGFGHGAMMNDTQDEVLAFFQKHLQPAK